MYYRSFCDDCIHHCHEFGFDGFVAFHGSSRVMMGLEVCNPKYRSDGLHRHC